MPVTINFMENLLLVAAEAESFFIGTNRSYEQELKEELLKILDEAELLFGPIDRSYELLEPRITERFYAQPAIFPSRKIRIYLTRHVKAARYIAGYELAHEAIHVMTPASTDQTATVLEEGLATYFSFKYAKQHYEVQIETTGDRHYDAAFRAVSTLLATNESVMKELRVHQPVISKIDVNLLVQVAGCDLELATFLCKDFQKYRTPPVSWRTHAAEGAQLFATGLRSILGS